VGCGRFVAEFVIARLLRFELVWFEKKGRGFTVSFFLPARLRFRPGQSHFPFRAGFFSRCALSQKEKGVEKEQKQALQVAKEIVVKFIEVGRVTPTNFAEIFPQVYLEVLRAVELGESKPLPAPVAAKSEQKG
jgi:hypothetical protein